MRIKRVLVVEDEGIVVKTIKKYLKDEDITLEIARTRDQAMDSINKNEYDALLVDLYLPAPPENDEDIDGIQVMKHARKVNPLSRCIVLTNHDEKENLVACMKAGACNWVDKATKGSYKAELLKALQEAFAFYGHANGLQSLIGHYTREAGCLIHQSTMRCGIPDEIDTDFARRNVFVAIPAANYSDEKASIKRVLEDAAGLHVIIEMDTAHSADMLCNICKYIRISPYSVVDISSERPNLLYELGLMHALSRRVAVLFNSEGGTKNPPSDLAGLKYQGYKQPSGGPKTAYLEQALCKWVLQNVPEANHAKVREAQSKAEKVIAG